MEFRHVETRGGRTKVRVYEGGSGDELVFLHGAGGVLPDDPFLAALSTRYRVFAPVLPGYEDSEGEQSLPDMLATTLHGFDVLDALGVRRPVLVGHSLGGMIAAEMAAIAPYEVERLVLIAPAGLWLDEHPIPDIFAKLPPELPPLLFHDLSKAALMTAGADFGDEAWMAEFLVANARRLGMAGKLLFPIPNRRLCDRLYRVTAKTLLVWGERDQLIVPAYAERFRELLPGTALTLVPDAGHMVPYEETDAVLDAIGAFLERA